MDAACDARARLRGVRGFVLDMDGTLVLGDKRNNALKPLPGAVAFVESLNRDGVAYSIFTNGTTRPPETYAALLQEVGFQVDETAVMTPARAAGDYFARKKYKRVMVLGGEGVSQPVEAAGVAVMRPPYTRDSVAGKDIDAVFVGWYREFTMDDIEAACFAVWNGAKLYSSSQAPFFATAEGRTLGTSVAMVGAVQAITGCRAKILGKPSLDAMRTVSRRIGVALEDLAVVGDDVSLEIPMAHRCGALAVAVRTGISSAVDVANLPMERRPHLMLENISELLTLYQDAQQQ